MPLAIRDIQYFLAVAKAGQLSSAAEAQGVTQPALTKAVRRVEQEFGLQIFERSVRGMVISGGFNVYPKEIEDVIAQHPAVAAVAVIGVPDERWGEAVKAIVVKRSGAQIEPEDLRELVRHAKGAVCTPKTVDFADALPLTPLGKPDKKALRERYWGNLARSIH